MSIAIRTDEYDKSEEAAIGVVLLRTLLNVLPNQIQEKLYVSHA